MGQSVNESEGKGKQLSQTRQAAALRVEVESGETPTATTEPEAAKEFGENDEELNVQFRSRKRARKTRAKRVLEDDKNTTEEQVGDEEMSRSELLLIRQAQRLREENRKPALDIRAARRDHQDGEKSEKRSDPSGDNVIGGLKEDFAVERSGHAMEERMEKYINEGMLKKFGDKEDPANASSADAKASDENDLFAIPERLRVEERPLYDPGEGLPAAGVEEVTLPEEVRRKNIEETVRAHKILLANKASRNQAPAVESLPGNLSANYVKHKSDWIAEHLGPKNAGRQNNSNAPQRGSANTSTDTKDNAKPDAGRRPRYQAATDSLIADRFKKRWRR